MEIVNIILGIVGSLFGIFATAVSLKNQSEIKKITKNSNNSQKIGNNSSNNVQTIGDGRKNDWITKNRKF
mgnify:CR=1 FL=1